MLVNDGVFVGVLQTWTSVLLAAIPAMTEPSVTTALVVSSASVHPDSQAPDTDVSVYQFASRSYYSFNASCWLPLSLLTAYWV